jgi:hypothetical protein
LTHHAQPDERAPRSSRRRSRNYFVVFVIYADRIAPLGAGATQIFDGQKAAVLLYRGVDGFAQLTVLYDFGASFGDQAKCPSKVLLDEGLPRPQGCPVVAVDVSRVLGKPGELRPDPTGRDVVENEPLVGELDGGLK